MTALRTITPVVAKITETRYTIDPDTGCWNWIRSKNKDGYGRVFDWENKKLKYAHRVSYEVHKGTIPQGLMVLHDCDNPSCVNPDHLHIGTAAMNAAECIARGRHNSQKI